jgi:hypothetical protein
MLMMFRVLCVKDDVMNDDGNKVIGTLGVAWGEDEKQEWREQQSVKRSYRDEVVVKMNNLGSQFVVHSYGALPHDPERYNMYVARSANMDLDKPTVLITGGVHGYETSGVQGAIRFLQEHGERYSDKFNLVVAPCVSPWGYETINRWNVDTVDPNRSFIEGAPLCAEAGLLMNYVSELDVPVFAQFDLHETTDTDSFTFRPALAARDGVALKDPKIDDGFYVIGDAGYPQDAFLGAMIASAEQVTHLAEVGDDGCIMGVEADRDGVVVIGGVDGLCMNFANYAEEGQATYRVTTEMYPDSKTHDVDGEECIKAQVAAICGGLDYIVKEYNL